MTQTQSRITRVELYRNRALITRSVTVPAGEAGDATVRLPGLPMLLADESVRVDLPDGGADLLLTDLHLELDLGNPGDELRTKGARSLRDLDRQRVDLAVARDRAEELVTYLERLQPVSLRATDLPDELAFKERHQVGPWLDLAASVTEQMVAARSQIRRLERELREVDDRINEAHDRLEAESEAEAQALATSRKAARLRLERQRPGDALEVELSYMVPAVRWVPEYELRVFDGGDEAELVLKARVGQRTGEDWEAVELSLSTADLTRSADLPRLDSWRIGKAQPPSRSGWRDLPDSTAELFDDYDRGICPVPQPTAVPLPDLPEAPRMGEAPSAPSGELAAVAVERLISTAAATPKPKPRTSEESITGEFPAVSEEAMAEEFAKSELEETMMLDEDDDEEWEDEQTTPTAPQPDLMRSPAPMSAAAPEAPMKKSIFGGRRASAPPPQGPEPSLPPASFFAADAPGGGGQARETRLTAGREALVYDNLRLQGPDRDGRGDLRASGISERLAEQVEAVAPGAAAALSGLPAHALVEALGGPQRGMDDFALPAYGVSIDESAGHFAVRYPMESPGRVLADGEPHLLTLLRRRGAVQRVFRCVPLLDTAVYQMARFENPLGLPLLAGPVRVYREGDFVVSGPLDTTPPGKSVTVNLGVEPGIVVARNTHFLETTHGLFGGDTALTHKVEIDVRSRLAEAVKVEVIERVPVSYDEDIEVKVLNVSPKAATYGQKDRGQVIHGGRLFALSLEPEEKTTCTLEYRITIPSKLVLKGGNRRD